MNTKSIITPPINIPITDSRGLATYPYQAWFVDISQKTNDTYDNIETIINNTTETIIDTVKNDVLPPDLEGVLTNNGAGILTWDKLKPFPHGATPNHFAYAKNETQLADSAISHTDIGANVHENKRLTFTDETARIYAPNSSMLDVEAKDTLELRAYGNGFPNLSYGSNYAYGQSPVYKDESNETSIILNSGLISNIKINAPGLNTGILKLVDNVLQHAVAGIDYLTCANIDGGFANSFCTTAQILDAGGAL